MDNKHARLSNSFQIIITAYLLTIFLFSLLLMIPWFHQDGITLEYRDSLFTAVSAVSVTGLTTISVADTFNGTGIIVLSLAIQLGGIGIMTLGTFTWIVLGKRINLAQRMLIIADQNRVQNHMSGLVLLMRQLLLLALAIECVGGLVLGTYYLRYFDTWTEAYVQGFFAALSAFTNAGFDLTGQSLQPFAGDAVVQLVMILLIIAGSIGFPVLVECREFLLKRKSGFRFSLFTKLTVSTYFLVFAVGTLGIWLFESFGAFAGLPWFEQFGHSLFQSATTRSAGLSTIDISQFEQSTLLFMSGLMIIGASPSSVGGGIRTTTLAVMVLTIRGYALGRNRVNAFGRQIHKDDQEKAFIVLSVAALLIAVSLISIAFFERDSGIRLLALIVEVASAFGTCGLTMGETGSLSYPSQIILMCLMFIGRVGIVAMLFSFKKKHTKSHYHYPTEPVIIG
ncbi:TrkH family potassium uptake protein [Shouchella clausii]